MDDDLERVDRGAGERQTPDYGVTRRAESFSSRLVRGVELVELAELAPEGF